MTRTTHWLKILALPFVALACIVGGATAAHAGSGAQWNANNASNYPNAWGGENATQINTYTAQTANNDFINAIGSGGWVLESGVTQFYYCIADYGGSSGDARAGLVFCGGGTPWGAYFKEYSCTIGGHSGTEFYNVHWRGYLGPSGSSNGDAYYLNKPSPYCFVAYPPA